MEGNRKTGLIVAVILIAVIAAAAVVIIHKQTSRPSLEDYEGTFRISNGKYLELKAAPTDEYDMKGRIYKEGKKADGKSVVGVYMPSGALSVEDPKESEDGVMFGILSIDFFGRYKYVDIDTEKTLTLEKL